MTDWTINKSLGQCFGTGQKIEFGQEYYAALVETEQGLQRQDFSAEFWASNKPAVFCFWKTRMPDPEQKKQLFIDDEMLMSFFERLEKETDPEKVNFRFVITLILMRKRKFKYDSSKLEDDKEVWKLRVVGESSFVEVINPHLDESKIEQLSSQLGQILQVDL